MMCFVLFEDGCVLWWFDLPVFYFVYYNCTCKVNDVTLLWFYKVVFFKLQVVNLICHRTIFCKFY